MNNQKGMTLIEVAIALLIFGLFVTAYISSESNNISASISFKGDLLLKDIAELKMNEELINPSETFRPDRGKVTISDPKDSDFKDIEEFPDYKFAVQYFKVAIPDISKITGGEENNPDQNQAIQKRIFDNFKKNMENLLWQVIVTIRHTPSRQTYSLSTWLYNEGGRLEFDIN